MSNEAINRTLTMLVFDRVEMSVIEMVNPRGHREVPTLHSYMTVSRAVRKFEEDRKNVVMLKLTPRFYRGTDSALLFTGDLYATSVVSGNFALTAF